MKASFALTLLTTLLASAFAAPTASLQKRTTTLFPNYLIPLKQSTPNTAYLTQYTATILYSGDDSTGNEQRVIGKPPYPYPYPLHSALRLMDVEKIHNSRLRYPQQQRAQLYHLVPPPGTCFRGVSKCCERIWETGRLRIQRAGYPWCDQLEQPPAEAPAFDSALDNPGMDFCSLSYLSFPPVPSYLSTVW